ncbi:polymorphic toxin type 50 domain-containing protein [Lactococcus taiwanensis]|uniref:polymorphic toxin type 50 domain-containing protein n=1 Tax=Lactococcus taiwanensis TaxID=1151742 RepID=UPI00351142B8
MKSVIGKTAPDSLEEYQEIKYNDGKQWAKLTDNYFVKSRLQDGRYGSTINPEKQAPHMASTVTKGKSYFEDDVDIQKLFDKYAGTGEVDRDINGRRKNTEVIVAKDFTGTAVSLNGEEATHTFKVHHSKKRLHIVPIKEGRNRE